MHWVRRVESCIDDILNIDDIVTIQAINWMTDRVT